MGPPYNSKTIKLLNDLIKAQAPAPADWPWYPIEIKGHAETYTEANKRLKILRTASYAFTTDSEAHGQEQAKRLTEFQKNKSAEPRIPVQEILDFNESLSSEDEDIVPGSQPNSNEDSNESSEEEEADAVIPRKKTGRKGQENFSKKIGRLRKAFRSKKEDRPKKKGDQPKKSRRSTKEDEPKETGLSTEEDQPNESGPSTNEGQSKKSSLPTEKDQPKRSGLLTKKDQPRKSSLSTKEDSLANVAPSKDTDHSKNGVISKQSLHATEQQVDNHHFSLGEDIFQLEKNLEIQSDALTEVVEGLPKDTAFIYIALKKLTVEVKHVGSALEDLRSSVERSLTLKTNVDRVSIINFEQKYDFQKLATAGEYEVFDKRLANDDEYIKDLKSAMECLIDSDIQRTIRRIFQRELAMNCTAYRQSGDKLLLRGTTFYAILFDFVESFHKRSDGGVLTEKEFYNTLSTCLTNSKDWDGHRKNRQIQPPAAAIPVNPNAVDPRNLAVVDPDNPPQNIEVVGNEN